MDITFNCEKCGQSLTIDEAGTGQLVVCPKCGKPIEVPHKSTSTNASTSSPLLSPPIQETKPCPFCAETIKHDATICRFCHESLTGKPIPSHEPSASANTIKPLSLILVIVILIGGYIAFNYWKGQQRAKAEVEVAQAKALAEANNAKVEKQLAEAKAEKAKAETERFRLEVEAKNAAEAERVKAEKAPVAELHKIINIFADENYHAKDFAFDVSKTASLVSPLIGYVDYLESEGSDDNKYMVKFKITFAYQDKKWVLKKICSVGEFPYRFQIIIKVNRCDDDARIEDKGDMTYKDENDARRQNLIFLQKLLSEAHKQVEDALSETYTK